MRRYYASLLSIALAISLGFTSCSTKEKTWRDYGDFHSFDEGFYFDGNEYHERLHVLRNGMMTPSFAMKIWSSVIQIHYASYALSTSPWGGGKSSILRFSLVADSLHYEPGKKWEMKVESDGRDCGEVGFSGDYDGKVFHTGYEGWDIKGWISFTIGEKLNTKYYKIQDCRFEFEITGPDGEELSITDGYKRHVGYESVGI